ncbi:MAG TPA: serine hydrolase, partial [Thermoanaerobaculia bacterium]
MTELEEFLAEEIGQDSFPGAVALVGDADAVAGAAFAGHAVVDPERVSVSADTLFDLASLTKPLACGALVAAVRPALDLAAPPGRYL